MAYQTRGRDPLFDSETQAMIERRGRELIGLALIACGIALGMTLGTYAADDPFFMSATSGPVENVFGPMGAAIAGPMVLIVGQAGWAIVAAFVVWGARFVLHTGNERALARAVFVPIGVALFSIYMATHMPSPDWDQVAGLGGMFGDAALGTILNVVGVGSPLALKLVSAVVMAATVLIAGFVLGFTTDEARTILHWMVAGTVLTYAGLLGGLRLSGRGLGQGARAGMDRWRTSREDASQYGEDTAPEDRGLQSPRQMPVLRADGPPTAFDPGDEDRTRSLIGRLGGLLRRAPEPEDDGIEGWDEPPLTSDEQDARVSARISDAVRARARTQPTLTAGPRTPSLGRRHPRGPKPIVLPKEPRVLDEDDDDTQPETLDLPEPEAPDLPAAEVAPAPRVVQPAPRRAPKPSARARAEAEPGLPLSDDGATFEAPPLSLLADPATVTRHHLSDEALEENARMLETVLDDYGVKGEIVSVRPGPVVTMYELEPAPGLKASRVIGLADDIARSMSALSARVSTVPGRKVIGIELPNDKREMCVLREILSTSQFGDGNHRLPLALGKDIGGDPVVANLAKMPHLLIAGTTGSGKSVAINTMILSLLYKLSPEECRLIMIDPKMLELSVYDGIPHLLSPVVTDPKKAVVALKWVVSEMEERYRKMSKMGVRNIEGYNSRVRDALSRDEMFERTVQTGFDDETGDPIFETEEIEPKILPFIVVVVDEMADLMMVAGKEIEACIQRLAQMARASGIHLIMATQRPSVDVITGTIKANFPTRISFQVTSKIDSRTILGEQGAEQLLGMGDMLYMAGGSKITRVHGPFCSDEEVEEIVTYLKQFGPPDYQAGVVEGPDDEKSSDIDAVLGLGGNTDGEDALYDQAVAIVAKDRKCSTSYIQRKLAIGYNKAARLVEQMEDEGVVSSANHVGKREVLVPEP